MKKLFFAISLLFLVAGTVTGNAPLAMAAGFGIFAFSHDWKEKVSVLSITLYPAQIKDASGNTVPMYTRCQKYLMEYLSVFGNRVTKDAIASGAIIWDPISYYIRYVITGLSGRQKVLGSANAKVLGVTNLDKGMLQQYYNFCYGGIAVRYATSAVALDSPANIAGYSSVLSSMPAGLRNGELIVSLNSQKQVETPINDFGSNAAITGGSTRNNDFGELEVPKVWQESLQVDVELNIPVVIPSAVNTTYVAEVQFYGVQARLS